MNRRLTAVIVCTASLIITAPIREALEERLGLAHHSFDSANLSATYIPSILRTGTLISGTTTLAGVNSNTSTIASVDTTASAVVLTGCRSDTVVVAGPAWYSCRAVLTNATTVTVTRNANIGDTLVASWIVLPLAKNFVKTLQSGTCTIATNATTCTIALSPNVTVNKTHLAFGGCETSAGSTGTPGDVAATGVISTSVITFTRGSAAANTFTMTCSAAAVELK